MANIPYFAEVANIEGVHIKMNASKYNLINIRIKNGKIIPLKACTEGLSFKPL